MSEKKRSRRRKDGYSDPGEQESEKPSKEEYKIAKWMKANLKTKKTKFLSHNVEYFTASKAVDALLKSKFATGDDPKFPSRDHIIEFLDIMLEHKFFHRAKKVPVTMEELRGSKSKSKDLTGSNEKDKNGEKAKDSKDKVSSKDKQLEKESTNASGDATKAIDADENSHIEGGGPTTTEDNSQQIQSKRKRKIRLDMHPDQIFVDGSEAYVWIYDPIPLHYWIYGFILVLGAIGICLFPLWPPTIRKGVYYMSVAAAGFLVFILALTVVRLIIFTLIWIVTAAKVHFWIFPNLTEDVGFFASFWPLYETKYLSDAEKTSKSDKKSKKSKKAKEKDSDAEDTATEVGTGKSIPPLEAEKIEQIKENPDADAELLRKRKNAASAEATTNSSGADNSDTQQDGSGSAGGDSDAKCSQTPSESESEISGRDYEIINPSEVQNVQ